MAFWPKRLTDAEYVELVRKKKDYHSQHAHWIGRVQSMVLGFFILGLSLAGLWNMGRFVAAELVPHDDQGRQTVIYAVLSMGTIQGAMLFVGGWMLVSGVFWFKPPRAMKLMLKYRDALVAHGIPVDEECEPGGAQKPG